MRSLNVFAIALVALVTSISLPSYAQDLRTWGKQIQPEPQESAHSERDRIERERQAKQESRVKQLEEELRGPSNEPTTSPDTAEDR